MNQLKQFKTLDVEFSGLALMVSLNRPEVRNAMNLQMLEELFEVLEISNNNAAVRALVISGHGEHFCAGGDIKDMASAKQQAIQGDEQSFYRLNRRFGALIQAVNQTPIAVIAVLRGSVMGGGFGLACVSDYAIADQTARFGLPETSLGIPPAQIAPFVAARIGLKRARYLALFGRSLNAQQALEANLIHHLAEDEAGLKKLLFNALQDLKRCAPEANKATKQILLSTATTPLEQLLDQAAIAFNEAVSGEEGQEGTMAFIRKQKPSWAQ